MFVPVVEKQSKYNLQAGQKICHNQYGYGMIVGFSAFTDEPMVYFYSNDSQRRFGDKLVCIDRNSISLVE